MSNGRCLKSALLALFLYINAIILIAASAAAAVIIVVREDMYYNEILVRGFSFVVPIIAVVVVDV